MVTTMNLISKKHHCFLFSLLYCLILCTNSNEIKPLNEKTNIGSKRNLDLSDSDVSQKLTKVADFAMDKINAQSSADIYVLLVRIKNATVQETLGNIYEMVLYVGSTNCYKNQVQKLKSFYSITVIISLFRF